MPVPQLTQEIIPTVIFRNNAVINESETKEKGRPIYDDMEVCDIFFPGNTKERVPTCRALDQADWIEDPQTQTKRPRTYMEKYAPEYQAFKSGAGMALSGTPLDELPFLTEAKRLELKHGLKIFTAEQLAALDGVGLKALGPGGRDLKDRAQSYLDTAKRGADTAYLKDELAKRDAQMEEMRRQIATLTANATTPNKATEEPAEDGQWATYTDEDISNMLKEAGVKVDGRWGRAKLIDEAETIMRKKKAA